MFLKSVSKFAVLFGVLAIAASAHAGAMKTTCVISASVHGGKKFATMKCSKAISTTGGDVRSTVWEKDDKKAYDKLARLAGRRFTCDMALDNTVRSGNVETTNYKLANCH